MRQEINQPSGIFEPYMKHYGRTPEEQLEKNKSFMEWLEKQIKAAANLTEEEIKVNSEYLVNLKQTIDSFRPEGHKLYSEE